MPHATMPSPGFQAFILCGPGASLDTFTSNPTDFPKAIIPIANRPMVWYSLDWCYRLGITDITLVIPPESKKAIENAMATNPHLTSLPLPRATVLAPSTLTMTSGTGDIFRQAEVVQAVKGDFVVLPCDLVSELDGTTLVQEWMIRQISSQGSVLHGGDVLHKTGSIETRGALGMWYETLGNEAITIKKEETDFIITGPSTKPIAPLPSQSIQQATCQLLSAMPTDSFNDIVEAKKAYQLRHSALRQFGKVNIRTSVRDSHVYFLPYWTIKFMQDERFESIGEDVIGWWSKSTWQTGLVDKLGINQILQHNADASSDIEGSEDSVEQSDDADKSAIDYSSTIQRRSSLVSAQINRPRVPPILAYVHASAPGAPLVKRVDTTKALLAVSLFISRMGATNAIDKNVISSPLAHTQKIAHPDSIPRITRVEADTCLLAENVTIGEKCGIKETVIGAGCTIGTGVKLTRCLLMDDVIIGDNVTLTSCVLGRRCKVEGGPRKGDERTELEDCEVQGGYVVAWGTENKGEKFMSFEGLDDQLKDDGSNTGIELEDDT